MIGLFVGEVDGGCDGRFVGCADDALVGFPVGRRVGDFEPFVRHFFSISHGNLQHSSRVS